MILIVTLCFCFAIISKSKISTCFLVIVITGSVIYILTSDSRTNLLSEQVSSQLARHKHKDDDNAKKDDDNAEDSEDEKKSSETQHTTPNAKEAHRVSEVSHVLTKVSNDTETRDENLNTNNAHTKPFSKYDIRTQHDAYFNYVLTRNSVKIPDFKAQNRYVNALFLDHERQTRKTDKYADDLWDDEL